MVRHALCALAVACAASGAALAAEPRQGPVTLLQDKEMLVWFKPNPDKKSVSVKVTDDTRFIDSQGKVVKGKDLFRSNLSKNDQITVWANDKDEASTIWFGQHKDEKEPADSK
jgi:hypothetical protein